MAGFGRSLRTKKRYKSSVAKLKGEFGKTKLCDISAAKIDDFKQARLSEKVEPATINHDLRVLRRMLHLAERKRLVARTPFIEVEFLKQQPPRPPHIVTFEEEELILASAPGFLRVLIVLILETGMRSHREALVLRWGDIDFIQESLRVRESKTRSGIRNIPLSDRCKDELQRWRKTIGPEFSEFVFPNMQHPSKPRKDIRLAWAKTLGQAKLEYFWIYNLRHTFASRLSAAGVSDLFVAQMIGHSSPSILQRYAKAIDEYRREAVNKLEKMRLEHASRQETRTQTVN